MSSQTQIKDRPADRTIDDLTFGPAFDDYYLHLKAVDRNIVRWNNINDKRDSASLWRGVWGCSSPKRGPRAKQLVGIRRGLASLKLETFENLRPSFVN